MDFSFEEKFLKMMVLDHIQQMQCWM